MRMVYGVNRAGRIGSKLGMGRAGGPCFCGVKGDYGGVSTETPLRFFLSLHVGGLWPPWPSQHKIAAPLRWSILAKNRVRQCNRSHVDCIAVFGTVRAYVLPRSPMTGTFPKIFISQVRYHFK